MVIAFYTLLSYSKIFDLLSEEVPLLSLRASSKSDFSCAKRAFSSSILNCFWASHASCSSLTLIFWQSSEENAPSPKGSVSNPVSKKGSILNGSSYL